MKRRTEALKGLLFAATFLQLSEALTTPASLVVTNQGDYVSVNGFAFVTGATAVYKTVQGNSACNCRLRCIVEPACKTLSYDSDFMCSMSGETTERLGDGTFIATADSTFVFWTADLSDIVFSVEADGLVYAYDTRSNDWPTGRSTCLSMPSFDLACMTEEGQVEITDGLRDSNSGEPWIGLKKIDGVAMFVNNVAFASSASSGWELAGDLTDANKACYYVRSKKLQDKDCADDKKRTLCQSSYALSRVT